MSTPYSFSSERIHFTDKLLAAELDLQSASFSRGQAHIKDLALIALRSAKQEGPGRSFRQTGHNVTPFAPAVSEKGVTVVCELGKLDRNDRIAISLYLTERQQSIDSLYITFTRIDSSHADREFLFNLELNFTREIFAAEQARNSAILQALPPYLTPLQRQKVSDNLSRTIVGLYSEEALTMLVSSPANQVRMKKNGISDSLPDLALLTRKDLQGY